MEYTEKVGKKEERLLLRLQMRHCATQYLQWSNEEFAALQMLRFAVSHLQTQKRHFVWLFLLFTGAPCGENCLCKYYF